MMRQSFHISLTRKCNEKCSYCSCDGNTPETDKVLSNLDLLLRAIKSFENNQLHIVIVGGEVGQFEAAFLDIFFAKLPKCSITLCTNGLFLDKLNRYSDRISTVMLHLSERSKTLDLMKLKEWKKNEKIVSGITFTSGPELSQFLKVNKTALPLLDYIGIDSDLTGRLDLADVDKLSKFYGMDFITQALAITNEDRLLCRKFNRIVNASLGTGELFQCFERVNDRIPLTWANLVRVLTETEVFMQNNNVCTNCMGQCDKIFKPKNIMQRKILNSKLFSDII